MLLLLLLRMAVRLVLLRLLSVTYVLRVLLMQLLVLDATYRHIRFAVGTVAAIIQRRTAATRLSCIRDCRNASLSEN